MTFSTTLQASMSVVLSVFLAVVVAHVLTWVYYRRRNSRSLLGQLRGPKSPSFWIGKRRLSKISTVQNIFPIFFGAAFCTMGVRLTILGVDPVRKRG